MRHQDYVADREERDPGFRKARQQLRPQLEFREALIGARLRSGLTQRELAEQLGTKQSAVARWESGRQMPSIETIQKVATLLGLDFMITPEAPLKVRRHRAA